ncbi:hypothetical protein AB3K25_05165 [Leuconostoc sp. MS02]|uniref:Uncharacterized protein n=1 Tax=Leuconostoc aquikimchii TaxID=3236804 RepID=A0ABV3S2M9_9LACO
MINQNKLKHAEKEVIKTLINKGFNLPLGEDENDVVWFGGFKKEIVESAPENLLSDRHAKVIKQIYDALPQDMKGRWQVGNTQLTSGKSKLAKANQLTNELLDDLFAKELKPEYADFKMSELLSQVKKRNKDSNTEKTKIASRTQEKNLDSHPLNDNQSTKTNHISDQMPVRGNSFNKISCLWCQDIRAETNAERQFLRNQNKVEQEKAQEEYESQISRGM